MNRLATQLTSLLLSVIQIDLVQQIKDNTFNGWNYKAKTPFAENLPKFYGNIWKYKSQISYYKRSIDPNTHHIQ